MVDFEKPDWGMTMQYPADWTTEDLGDMVKFTTEDYSKGLRQTNHLRVDCVGDTLSLYINGKRVKQIQDGRLTEGYVNLLVDSTESRGARFAFDNLIVRRP